MSQNETALNKLEAFDRDFSALLKKYESENPFQRPPAITEPEDLEQRLSEGRYLLRPCGVEFRSDMSGQYALDLFELLLEYMPEEGDGLQAIQEKFISGEVDRFKLLEFIFSNQGPDIARIVRQHGLSFDLMSMFAVYYGRPYRAHAAKRLLKDVDLKLWTAGYCPVCGHWPSLSHLHDKEGNRHLWCLHCGTIWPFKRLTCPFCLNEDYQKLDFVTPETNEPYRAQVCSKCKRYVKEIRTNLPLDDVPFDAVFLGTISLDAAVRQEGYIQESPLNVRYEDPEGNELLLYRQQRGTCSGGSPEDEIE
ncbi:formate dehydrogenase accessory protein FdhE [bacterium]|nr:formate dehydrogenase accessory protein FdhE [bacterium]MBU1921013.1 formate dehydrogenase accessory protein FdhE [bacterium]